MAVDDYMHQCEQGHFTIDVEALFRRAREWPDLTDEAAMVMTHGCLHTACARTACAISRDGQLQRHPPAQRSVMVVASYGAAGACWMLLGAWPDNPMGADIAYIDSEQAMRRIQSQVMVHMNLHEWALPPAGQ